MAKRIGFFSRFRRPEPESLPAPETARIVREIVRQGLPETPRKTAISLRLDVDVLEWFRGQGAGYQTRINAVLRAYRDAATD